MKRILRLPQIRGRAWLTHLGFVLGLLVSPFLAYGQSTANYTFSTNTTGSLALDMNSNAVDMTAGTTFMIGANNDDVASARFDNVFDFWLMGSRFTQFSASSNGIIRLGSTVMAAGTYTVGSGSALSPLVSAFGGDLATGPSGKIHYKVVGTAPNRCLVIEFLNMSLLKQAVPTNDGTYQVRLYETTNVIEYVYGAMTRNTGTSAGNSQQVGIGFSVNSTVNNFVSVLSATSTSNVTPSFTQQTYTSGAIANLNSVADGSRTTYRLTPATQSTTPTTFGTNTIANTSLNVTWADVASDELGYEVYYASSSASFGLDASANSNASFGRVAVAANAATATITGLTAGTTYFFKIYARREAFGTPLTGSATTLSPNVITSTGSGGNWNAPSTWVGGAIPTANDDVVIADGATVIIGNSLATYTCNNLAVGQGTSGTLEYETVAARTLIVVNNVTIATGGIFRTGATGPNTHALTLNGNLTNNGTLDFSTNANATRANITFGGGTNTVFGGTGTTDIANITLNKGTGTTAILEITLSNAFTVQGANTTGFLPDANMQNGTLKISGTFTQSTPIFTVVSYTIPSAVQIWLNNPNFTVSGLGGSPTCAGILRVTQGTFTVGTGPGNSLGLSTGAILTIDGGTLNTAARVFTSNDITFNMSSGTINVCTVANTATNPSFGLTGTGNIINWSGGTVVLNQANSNVTAANRIDYNVVGSNPNITGGKLQVGVAGTATIFDFKIQGVIPELEINTATNTKTATLFGNATVYLSSTLVSTLATNGNNFTLLGNLINNGVITSNTFGKVAFGQSNPLTSTALTYSGSGTMGTVGTPNNNLEVLTTGGLTLSQTQNIITTSVSLSTGTLVNSAKVTVGNGGSSSPNITLGAGITTLPSGTFDVAPTFNIGTGGLMVTYSTCSNAVTTGVEIPSGRALRNLAVNNTNGVTLAGGDLSVNIGTPPVMSIGGSGFTTLTLGNNNLILGVSGFTNTLTVSSSSLIITNGTGSFTRSTGVSLAAGTSGLFPVAASASLNRQVTFATSAAITTGGTITVRHADASGTTTVGAFTDNGVSIDTRTNASWIISTSGLNLGAQTLTVAVTGSGLYANLFNTAEMRLVNASAAIAGSPVTFASTGTAPNFIGNRSFVNAELANLNTTMYMGVNSSNIVGATITSITTGNWGDASTWDTGTVPNASNPVIIASGHNVTLAGTVASPYSAGNLTVNGTLTANANTLTIGPAGGGNRPLTFSTTGAFVLGGSATVNVNGNVIFNGSSTLAMTGGNLNIDGNTGTASSSVADGTHLLNFNNSGSTVASAGTITIVDPPHSSTSTSLAVRISRAVNTVANFLGSTIQFGDGVSTTSGPAANGFTIDNFVAAARIPLGNVIVNGGNTTDRFVRNSLAVGTGTYIAGNLTINAGSEFRITATTANNAVGGNIVNNGTLSSLNTLRLGSSNPTASTTQYVITTPQTISGTGTFQNNTSGATANFTSLTLDNAGGATINALSATGTGAISSTLTLTTGNLTIGTGVNFVLGVSGTTLGTGSFSGANGIITNGTGTFGRWQSTTAAPTTFLTSNSGYFPFTTSNNTASSPSRVLQLSFSSTTALSTAGVIAFNYTEASGTTDVTPFTDGITIERRLNSTWTSSTTGVAMTGTVNVQIAPIALYYPNDATLMRITEPTVALGGANGTNATTGTYPNTTNTVQRTGLSLAGFTGKTLVLASSIANLPREIQSAQDGAWEVGTTWVGGIVPTTGDNVTILNTHDVTFGGTGVSYACNQLTINTGATLALGATTSGESLGVTGTSGNNKVMLINGGLSITDATATLNVNGRVEFAGASTFTMTAGNFNIDGNSGSAATSVPSGSSLHILNFSTTGNVSATGGTITLVDPHIGTASTERTLNISRSALAGIDFTGNTIRFGDGVSTVGNATNGFGVNNFVGSAKVPLGNVIVNGGNATDRFVSTLSAGIFIKGTLTINTSSDFRIGIASTISGDIVNNGFFTHTGGVLRLGSTATTASSTDYVVTTVQTLSGTGVYRNATASPTAALRTVFVDNAGGIIINSLTGAGGTTGTIEGASTLTLQNGNITLASGIDFIIGHATGSTGTLAVTSGFFFILNGTSTLTRWYGIASLPTAANTVNASYFPISHNGTTNRSAFVYFSATNALSTGGKVSIRHNNVVGLSTVNFTAVPTAQQIDRRTNANWVVTQTGLVATGTIAVAFRGDEAISPTLVANTRVVLAGGQASATSTGVGSGSSANPQADVNTLTVAQLAQTFYLGTSNVNLSFTSIATGKWENASTWDVNAVPTSGDNVFIANGFTVTIDATTGTANALAVNVNSGILNVNGGALSPITSMTQTGGTVNLTSGSINLIGLTQSTTGSPIFNVNGGTLNTTNTISQTSTNGAFNLISGTVNVGTGGSFQGALNISGGSMTNGTAGGNNNQFWIQGTGSINMSNGTLTVNGNFPISGSFTQTGGLIVVDGNSGTVGTSVASGTAHVSFASAAVINASAGTIRVVDPPHNTYATGTTRSFQTNNFTGTGFTGTHTVEIGDGVSTETGNTDGFVLDTYVGVTRNPIQNLIINGGNATGRWTSTSFSSGNGLHIKGTLTINNGSELRHNLSTCEFMVAGDLVNNGTLTTVNTLTLGGGASIATAITQNVGGTGTFRNATTASDASFNSITVNNANVGGTVNWDIDASIKETLTLTAGVLDISNQTLTFHTNATPISRTSGTITANTSTNLAFGTTTAFGGTAFTIPNGTFTSAPSINNFTLIRTNDLTLGNQDLTVNGTLDLSSTNAGRLVRGTANLVLSSGANVITSKSFDNGVGNALNNFTLTTNLLINTNTNFVYQTSTNANLNTGALLPVSIGNLTVNHTGTTNKNLVLTNALTVSNTLTMTSGNIDGVTNNRLLTLGTSAVSTGTLAYTSGTIIGQFKRWIAASATGYNFPIGIATQTRNANITYIGAPSTGGSLTAQFIVGSAGTSGIPLTEGAITVTNVFQGVWQINAGDGLVDGTYTATINGFGISGITDFSKLVMLKRANNASAWTLEGTHITTTGSNGLPVLQRTGLTGFSEFGIGGSSENPLPITLLDFKGVRLEDTEKVQLQWSTASEINNKGFEIEVSENGLTYRKIAFVEGKGNSSTIQPYSHTTIQPNDAYYRLKQVDFDGKFSYSPVVFVEGIETLKVYPNPNKGNFTIALGKVSQTVSARLLNAQGKEVWNNQINATTQVTTNLPSGIYFLHTVRAGKTKVVKIVIE